MMESAASAMIWNFGMWLSESAPPQLPPPRSSEEGLGADSTEYITESLGASSAGSDGDHHLSSALIASIGPRSHSIPQAEACGPTTISLLDVRDFLEPFAPPPLEQVTRCPSCMETFREPKVLACFHSFCKPCLKRQFEEGSGGVLGASSADSGHGDSVNTVPSPTGTNNKIVCQLCSVETQLSPQLGVEGLLSDYGLEALLRKAGGGDRGPSTSPVGSDQKQEQDHQPPGCETMVAGGLSKTGEKKEKKKSCTGCKSGEPAFAYCVDCSNHLCAGCTQAHRNMHCFEGHRVEDLLRAATGGSGSTPPTPDAADGEHCKCLEHRSHALHFFCATCNLAICRECSESEHTQPSHQVEAIADVAEKQIAAMELLNTEARRKYSDLVEAFRSIDAGQTRLNASLQAAKATIDASAQAICHMVLEAQKEMLRELENTFGYKQYRITCVENDLQRLTKKMSTTMDFTQRLLKHSSPTEVMVFKPLLDSRLKGFINFNFNSDANTALLQSSPVEIRPVDLPQVRQAIFCLFSSMRARVGEDNSSGGGNAAGDGTLSATENQFKPQSQLGTTEDNDVLSFPYSDIPQRQVSGGGGDGSNGNSENSTFADFLSCVDFAKGSDSPPDSFRGNAFSADIPVAPAQQHNNTFSGAQMIRRGNVNHNHPLGVHYSPFEPRDRTHQQQPFGVSAPVGNGPLSSRMFFDSFAANGMGGGNQIFNSQYEKWSAAMDPSSLGALSLADPETINDLSILAGSTEKLLNGGAGMGPFNPGPWQQHPQQPQQPVYSSRSSHIKRLKMTYHCKFGEFGVLEGQFTEPSGVAVNAQSDIVVADTNNHRIQVFDREGRFKFQFGECGKRDGQLLYPNRVAVNRVTGDFIVTERSPTHQIQIYNQYGQFIRKFGANILQHPRGVCVDHQGRIIVVECKVMRVIIFDTQGNEFRKFSCSRYLEFPNGVCATSNNEILISDNRAHCVKVFDYEGLYLRQIGGEGITNYPIGVGLNSKGEVVVADNHNNFNLTIFSQDGSLLHALESKVKHAQCFDVALVDDGSVVLASKDYRLYLYRYQYPQQHQPSCIGGDNPHHAMHSFYPFN